jgi:hypothetical protein
LGFTLKHVLDQHATLNDIPIGVELLVVAAEEENHV